MPRSPLPDPANENDRELPRTLVLGGAHVLGWALSRHTGAPTTVASRTRRPWPANFLALDVEDEGALATVLAKFRPGVVLYGAGICNVRDCEQDASWGRTIVVGGVENLLAHLLPDTRLVYLSSDHVFSGDRPTGHPGYDEDSPRDPITRYGELRVEAEDRVLRRAGSLVVRTGVAIGPSISGRTGFADWIAHRHARSLPLTLVEGERRSFALSSSLARVVWQLALGSLEGVVHVASSVHSRQEAAAFISKALGLQPVFDTKPRTPQLLGDVALVSRRIPESALSVDAEEPLRRELTDRPSW